MRFTQKIWKIEIKLIIKIVIIKNKTLIKKKNMLKRMKKKKNKKNKIFKILKKVKMIKLKILKMETFK